MPFKLVCVYPFHDRQTGRDFDRGDELFDPDQVARMTDDRESHFVRVAISDEELAAATAS